MALRLPRDVRDLLPQVAQREDRSPHALAVEAITNRVRRAARRHGLTQA